MGASRPNLGLIADQKRWEGSLCFPSATEGVEQGSMFILSDIWHKAKPVSSLGYLTTAKVRL